jgi:dolichol kinase
MNKAKLYSVLLLIVFIVFIAVSIINIVVLIHFCILYGIDPFRIPTSCSEENYRWRIVSEYFRDKPILSNIVLFASYQAIILFTGLLITMFYLSLKLENKYYRK